MVSCSFPWGWNKHNGSPTKKVMIDAAPLTRKRVVITGHSSGIGNALLKLFQHDGFVVDGFSRTTGHNIANPDAREKIINYASTADIFINNAYDCEGQLILLKEMTRLWEGTNKLIINMGSKGVHMPVLAHYEEYLHSKRQQHDFIKSRFLKGSPRIFNVVAGLVDTQLIKHWDVKKLDVNEFAKIVYFLAMSKISVQEVMLDVDGVDWKEMFWKSQ